MAEDHIDSEVQPRDVVDEETAGQEETVVEAETVVEEETIDGAETVDGMPVLADVHPIEPSQPSPLPAVQAAAVAATGFVAGAATMALVRRHAARKVARSHVPSLRRVGEGLPGVGPGRTFLVHVRVIGRPED